MEIHVLKWFSLATTLSFYYYTIVSFHFFFLLLFSFPFLVLSEGILFIYNDTIFKVFSQQQMSDYRKLIFFFFSSISRFSTITVEFFHYFSHPPSHIPMISCKTLIIRWGNFSHSLSFQSELIIEEGSFIRRWSKTFFSKIEILYFHVLTFFATFWKEVNPIDFSLFCLLYSLTH